jgi:cytochrome c
MTSRTPILLVLLFAGAASAQTVPGDLGAGKALWERTCANCHALDYDGEGPRHRGVYGRKAGTADHDYSPALKDSGIVWSEDTLERWLTNPEALIPGQRMNFKIASPADRANVIAYLKSLSAP